MTLNQFMEQKKLTRAQMAERLGVTGEAVRLWLAGKRIPKADYLRTIAEVTGGRVTPNDFVATKRVGRS